MKTSRMTGLGLSIVLSMTSAATSSRADDVPPPLPAPAPTSEPESAPGSVPGSVPESVAVPVPAPGSVAAPVPEAPKVTVGGYVEAYYSYNLNSPPNGITNYRWLDNRHNSFQLATAVLDVAAELSEFRARIALQAGPTADGWYADSIEARTGASGASSLNAGTWKHIQQASVGWKAPVGRGLLLEAGLFVTPVGFEVAAVKDNWTWSRSNLFYALPFYHSGVRATYEVSDRLTAMTMLTNGWNDATDVNDGKSGHAQLLYTVPDAWTLSLLYMGGPERPQSSPEGRPWRHLFDAWAQAKLHKTFSVAAHGDAGFEKTNFGVHSWRSAALYARAQPVPFLYIAARGDAFFEDVAHNARGTSSSPFFGADMWSLTGTFDVRAVDHLSLRAEARHDVASTTLFFRPGGDVEPQTGALVPNARTQTTLTLGVTGWF